MTDQLLMLTAPGSSAVISACGRYRYRLERRWGPGTSCVFVMLNPSTADARTDDATIRKCRGFTQRWGHDAFTVINLYAFRARDPKRMLAAADPVGPENDRHIIEAIREPARMVLAWGANAQRVRVERVIHLLRHHCRLPRQCLGLTKGGEPWHPLMVPYETPLMEYPQ